MEVTALSMSNIQQLFWLFVAGEKKIPGIKLKRIDSFAMNLIYSHPCGPYKSYSCHNADNRRKFLSCIGEKIRILKFHKIKTILELNGLS